MANLVPTKLSKSVIPQANGSNTTIWAGSVVLSTAGGVCPIAVAGITIGDIAVSQLKTDDSGTAITSLATVATAGVLTITRTDDGSSADDGVADFIVIRNN